MAALYYMERTNDARTRRLMAVAIRAAPGGLIEAGPPVALFEWPTATVVPEANVFSYSPSLDGQRFLMNVLPDAALPTLNVITNWEKAAKNADTSR